MKDSGCRRRQRGGSSPPWRSRTRPASAIAAFSWTWRAGSTFAGVHREVHRPPRALQVQSSLHLHLTDDQGWRLEIKKYPRLTQVGAWRNGNHRGAELRSLLSAMACPMVALHSGADARARGDAAARHVTIIPEIEMPTRAGGPRRLPGAVVHRRAVRGVDQVGRARRTSSAHANRLRVPRGRAPREVMQLFPSEYIHIGGDEVPKKEWKDSPVAQDVIRREGLGNEEGLQGYFIRRIEGFLRAHGRRLIGWTRPSRRGLAPEATVMSWRGVEREDRGGAGRDTTSSRDTRQPHLLRLLPG